MIQNIARKVCSVCKVSVKIIFWHREFPYAVVSRYNVRLENVLTMLQSVHIEFGLWRTFWFNVLLLVLMVFVPDINLQRQRVRMIIFLFFDLNQHARKSHINEKGKCSDRQNCVEERDDMTNKKSKYANILGGYQESCVTWFKTRIGKG